MTCDYKLVQDLIVKRNDLEIYRIYGFDVVDRFYCSEASEFDFYNEQLGKESEPTVLFERTFTTKKWNIDNVEKVKEIIDHVKNCWFFTDFEQVMQITSVCYIENI